ncbi:MAG: CoA-binding protein, partial [Candidatus Hydrogenedentota bacterium]
QLDYIFKPTSLAVIGASNNRQRWGYGTLQGILRAGFRGKIYPINPNEEVVQGLAAYPSVLGVPDEIDLAVFVVKAAQCVKAMDECARKGVKGGVVITAGFAEVGGEGGKMQDEIVGIARREGLRFVGPNCLGIWSSAVSLDCCFYKTPLAGPIGFISQSGTLGEYLLEIALEKGYGFSKFISSGNQADLDVCDYLEYLADDPDTKTIVLYLEGLRDGRKFLEISRKVIREKAIIMYKAGHTSAGVRAAMSHTASLAGNNELFEAACRQAGIIRSFDVLEAFDIAEALAHQPLPRSNRVAIVSGGGGFCVTAADACASFGLELPELDAEAQQRILSLLEDYSPPPRNPVDMIAQKGPISHAEIIEILAQLDYIDGIIITPPWGGFNRDTPTPLIKELIDSAERISQIPGRFGKPIISAGAREYRKHPIYEILKKGDIPFFEGPNTCARAMQGLVEYAQIRKRALAQTLG